MTHALIRVYQKAGAHLDAYSMAEHFVPELMGERRWIPELEAEALPLQRIFLAEKWIVARLHYGHVDPREAGVGNIVNCGAAMYVAPVGVVNAGDPDAAYAEAIDLTGAHQSSYGREAAGVMAAAVAEAMRPGATVDGVIAATLRLAKDGTRAAIDAVCDAARGLGHWDGSFEKLRAAMRPFDTVADTYRDQGLGARRPPARTASKSCRWRWPSWSWPRAMSARPCWAASTTGVTPTRSPPWAAPSRARSAVSPRCRPVGLADRYGQPYGHRDPGLDLAAVARRVHTDDVARRRAHEGAFAELAAE